MNKANWNKKHNNNKNHTLFTSSVLQTDAFLSINFKQHGKYRKFYIPQYDTLSKISFFLEKYLFLKWIFWFFNNIIRVKERKMVNKIRTMLKIKIDREKKSSRFGKMPIWLFMCDSLSKHTVNTNSMVYLNFQVFEYLVCSHFITESN